jgi:hypothetical protein
MDDERIEAGERVLPCEGCGTDVHFISNDDAAFYWAEGVLIVRCHACAGMPDRGRLEGT